MAVNNAIPENFQDGVRVDLPDGFYLRFKGEATRRYPTFMEAFDSALVAPYMPFQVMSGIQERYECAEARFREAYNRIGPMRAIVDNKGKTHVVRISPPSVAANFEQGVFRGAQEVRLEARRLRSQYFNVLVWEELWRAISDNYEADETVKEWQTTYDMYHDMREVSPPTDIGPDMFMVGEATRTTPRGDVFAVFRRRGDVYTARLATLEEFNDMKSDKTNNESNRRTTET